MIFDLSINVYNLKQIKVEDVGELYKIRLGRDNDGVSLGWHIHNVS